MTDQQRVATPGVIIRMLFFVVVIPFLPFVDHKAMGLGSLAYAVVSILGFVISRILVS
jgi:hypothetical protein